MKDQIENVLEKMVDMRMLAFLQKKRKISAHLNTLIPPIKFGYSNIESNFLSIIRDSFIDHTDIKISHKARINNKGIFF